MSLDAMDALLLQDWTVIAGASNVTVTQGADSWIDLGDYEDLIFYVDVKEFSGGALMTYQTAPSKQEAAFVPLLAQFPLANGLRVDRAIFGLAQVPPARYVRWTLTGSPGTPWDATFRIWLAAYSFA